MAIELPESLESAVKQKALISGLSPKTYLRQMTERELDVNVDPNATVVPFKDSYGILEATDLRIGPTAPHA